MNKRDCIILIDNGHGENTPGKCSPDRSLFEWAWARDMAVMIACALNDQGYNAQLLVREAKDVSLGERVRRANTIRQANRDKHVILVSVHINAAGADGKWHSATGWSGWVANTASNNSKRLAKLLYEEAEAAGLQGNRSVPPTKFWSANFYILRKTLCPAVLTENLFQDNEEEVRYLKSQKGREAIRDLHVNAIIKYINTTAK